MSEVMLVWVRVWDVLVRLMTTCTILTCVPGQCERRAFAREVYLSMVRWWVSLIRLLSAVKSFLSEFYE
jgi:hypothetical protein